MARTPDQQSAPDAGAPHLAPHRTVVVGCDGSWQSRLALERAATEARRRGARLVVLGVAVPSRAGQVFSRGDWARVSNEAAQSARYVVVDACRRVTEAYPDVPVSAVVAETVKDRAVAELGALAELLVLGRRGAGGRGVFVLGSMSDELARRFWCPLLICQDDPGSGPERPDKVSSVVVGISSQHDADVILDLAAAEAQARACPLTIVRAQGGHVGDRDPLLDRVWQWLQDRTDGQETPAVAGAGSHVATSTPSVVVTKDEPVTALVNRVEQGDLLVVGTRGEGSLAGLIVGSVARGVLDRMPCDILIVRATTRQPQPPTVVNLDPVRS
ncbi:universal stress protein [Lapillicoccus sp.]|uniref:universal stress protein n=1 Tax=Lapillicoccus sp. TaxID=1909287 RepID=UPI0039838F2E